MAEPTEALLAGIDLTRLHLTRRQAEVCALRAQGLSQSQIAARWGTSRANVCQLERAARRNIRRSRETVAFHDQLTAPLHVEAIPGELLLDVQHRLAREAARAGLPLGMAPPDVLRQLEAQAGGAVRDGRLTRPVLLSAGGEGILFVRVLGAGTRG